MVASQAMEEMLLFYDMEDLIVTATKHPQKVADAPAIATVISSDEIRKMGARTLIDIFRKVPGMGTSYSYISRQQVEIRGIKTPTSVTVKVLIDGHAVNTNSTGGFDYFWNHLDVDSIKRIEIVRGPGSALYGSNAISGVINIITKESDDINGTLLTLGGGSFDTGKISVQSSKQINDIDTVFFLTAFKKNGARLHVEKDFLGNSGDTDQDDKYIDASIKLKKGNLSLKSRFIDAEEGPYIGVTNTLNDESIVYSTKFFAELTFEGEIGEDTPLIVTTYMDQFEWKAYWEGFPEGFLGLYPDGLIGIPTLKERIFGFEVQLDHHLSEDNRLTVGILAEKRKQFDVTVSQNYYPNNFPFPVGYLQNQTDITNWTENTDRYVRAAYIQDIWDLKEELSLTAGIRHDNYSDFGSSTNPRAAAVWRFKERWDLKFLYGEAFRAPSFEELYLKNNAAIEGNRNLKAEEMTTYELSLGHRYEQGSSTRLTVFENSFKNKIDDALPVGTKFKYINVGGLKVRGIEAEWDWAFSADDKIYLNYTYQRAKDLDTGDRLSDIADHKGNLGFNMKLSDHFNINTNIFMTGEKRRAANDLRSPLPGYTIVDMALIAKEFHENLEIRTAIHNLLDKNYADPAHLYETAPGSGIFLPTIPNDYPREGISFMLEAQYKF